MVGVPTQRVTAVRLKISIESDAGRRAEGIWRAHYYSSLASISIYCRADVFAVQLAIRFITYRARLVDLLLGCCGFFVVRG